MLYTMSKALAIVPQKKKRANYRYKPRQRIPLAVYTGKGGYRKVAAKPRTRSSAPWGSMIGAGLGTAIAGPVGGLVGGGLGHLTQELVSHFTGVGDYQIEVNSLMGGRFNPPELINKSQRGVRMRHREYIADITASSAFTIQAFDLNPGLANTFPWLAGVANNFEQYAIEGMIFEYKSLSADYTTASSAALGYVAMATQYNSLAPNFTDKVHLENYEFANSAKPSQTFIHPVECKRSLTSVDPLYIRTGPVETNADQRLYDLGKFQIATGGNSGSGILGELWCTYEVCFYKPKLVDAEDLLLAGHWQLNSVTAASPLGAAAATEVVGTNLECTLTGGSVTFPATLTEGRFLVEWNVIGSSTASTVPPTITATSNCSFPNKFVGNVLPSFSSQSSITAAGMLRCWTVTITGPSAVMTINDDGTLPTSVTAGDLWIAQLNSEL